MHIENRKGEPMILDIKVGDITDPSNKSNIIIAMNTTLEDVTGIGVPFVKKINPTHPIQLGSVLNFQFDRDRMLHMLICHDIGYGGWVNADKWVRLGLDHLWQASVTENHILYDSAFSIVQIGTGQIGRRDGANSVEIMTAMATSYLDLTLFVRDKGFLVPAKKERAPLYAMSTWHPMYGEEKLFATT